MMPCTGIVTEPIPISLVAGRYLLFDINVVTYLRRTHNICGVLIGSIPQIPQQNVFLGLPVELLPEEAKLLVEKEVGYIVDDASWHTHKFSTLGGEDKRKYLETLRSEAHKARRLAEERSQKSTQRALAKQALLKAPKESSLPSAPDLSDTDVTTGSDQQSSETSLFDSVKSASRSPSTSASITSTPYTITPTTSYSSLSVSLPQNPSQQPDPLVPASYPLFAHLHALDYFITPGLRFGCDYTVYPGDPLRFHSHFLAVGYDWEEEIPLIDLIGGGRLGTGVKKGFLIGGEDLASTKESHSNVRTFCIEWGGM
jgi:tRNA-splicing endonuclease subunit Sen34